MQTTVVGNYPKVPNLPKPAKLRNAINEFDTGRITLEQLRKIKDEVTIEVIHEQVNAGIDIITDGQIRWDDAQTYFAKDIEGFSINGLIRYFNTNTYYRQPIIETKLKWNRAITVNDFNFAVQNSNVPVKAVVIGPYTLARLSKNNSYKDFDELILDLALILNNEVVELQEAGANFIQIDEPAITNNFVDDDVDVDLLKEAVAKLFKGISAKKSLYTYFGTIDGLYPDILDFDIDVLGLDFVMGRENFEILEKADFTKELGFGIIDARNTKLEKKIEIINNIKKITRIVQNDKLYINPSCGLEFLPRENAYAKLVNMVSAVKDMDNNL
ncbi:MAG: methylcobamide--CoM methyltransferase [Nanoarchaeota archaeon]